MTPPYHVIELDQPRLDIANAYLNEGSPNSIQSHPNVLLTQEELKSSMQNDKYFSNKLMNSGSTSRDELNTDQVVSNQLDKLDTQPLASPNNSMPTTTPLSTDSGAIKIEISGRAEEEGGSHPRGKYYDQLGNSQLETNNLQSPVSADSAAGGIQKGSMSLSSSTSKDNNQPPPMGMAPDRMEEQSSLVNSQGPDITFGMLRSSGGEPQETTANTSSPLEESKEEEHHGLKPSAGVVSLNAPSDFNDIK